jgi:hypothetical protein
MPGIFCSAYIYSDIAVLSTITSSKNGKAMYIVHCPCSPNIPSNAHKPQEPLPVVKTLTHQGFANNSGLHKIEIYVASNLAPRSPFF